MPAEPTSAEPMLIDGQGALVDLAEKRELILADLYADWQTDRHYFGS